MRMRPVKVIALVVNACERAGLEMPALWSGRSLGLVWEDEARVVRADLDLSSVGGAWLARLQVLLGVHGPEQKCFVGEFPFLPDSPDPWLVPLQAALAGEHPVGLEQVR